LLELIDDYVNKRSRAEKKPRGMIRFTQRQLREAFGWGDFQLRRHLARLIELEYVLAYRTGARNQREYELLYDGQGRDGDRFLLGLVDVSKLVVKPQPTPRQGENDHSTGQNDARPMPLRSGSDAPSMPPKNVAKNGRANDLRPSNGNGARKKVKRTYCVKTPM
jgi:hypothetical protein